MLQTDIKRQLAVRQRAYQGHKTNGANEIRNWTFSDTEQIHKFIIYISFVGSNTRILNTSNMHLQQQ